MPTPRALGRSGVLLAVAVAAGCDEAPTTIVDRRVEGPWSLAQGAMVRAPLPVVVQGDPFTTADSRLEEHVVEVMTETVTWTATPGFTADPAAAASRALRVVITFNGRESLNGDDQCSGRSRGGGPLADDRVRVDATFCNGATTLVRVSGHAGDAERPDGERFRELIRQVTLDMFTPEQTGR